MNESMPPFEQTMDDHGNRAIKTGEQVCTSLAECVAALPQLASPEHLLQYCDILNFLARGLAYTLISDPDSFRAQFAAKMASEDPSTPWQDGNPQTSDFEVTQMNEITPPRIDGETAIFYVADDYLGIPYRVSAAWPNAILDDMTYSPL